MSNNRFQFDGLAELRAALRALPSELVGEGSNIVLGEGNAAAFEIKSGYAAHRRSGNLQDRVDVIQERSQFVAGVLVRNTSPHAVIFENGTQIRHDAKGRNRGAMPPGHVFVPVMIRRRRRMYGLLGNLLTRHGLQVSGDAG